MSFEKGGVILIKYSQNFVHNAHKYDTCISINDVTFKGFGLYFVSLSLTTSLSHIWVFSVTILKKNKNVMIRLETG